MVIFFYAGKTPQDGNKSTMFCGTWTADEIDLDVDKVMMDIIKFKCEELKCKGTTLTSFNVIGIKNK